MRRTITLALLITTLLSILVPVTVAAGQPEPTRLRWLALGDSYSSGEGVYGAGRSGDHCARSKYAWAQLAAQWVRIGTDPRLRRVLAEFGNLLGVPIPAVGAPVEVDMTFLACSGAETTEAGAPEDLDEQLAQTTGKYDVVTFTFGGNDTGFGPIIKKCLNPTDGFGCEDTEEGLMRTIREEVAAKLDVAYRKIREQVLAPGGRVIVLGYPRLFDAPHPLRATCLSVPRHDIAMLRRVAGVLNATVAGMAERHHFDFVDVATPFEGHNACGGTPQAPLGDLLKWLTKEQFPLEFTPLCLKTAWVNGVSVGAEAGGRIEHSFHPNVCGHVVESLLVAARVLGWQANGDARVRPHKAHLYHGGMAFEISDAETVQYRYGDAVGPIADMLTEMFGLPGPADTVPVEPGPCGAGDGRMTWKSNGAAILSLGVRDGTLVSYQQHAEHPAIATPDAVTAGSPAWMLMWKSGSRVRFEDASVRIGADTAYRYTRIDTARLGDPPRTGFLKDRKQWAGNPILELRDGPDPDTCAPVDPPTPTESTVPPDGTVNAGFLGAWHSPRPVNQPTSPTVYHVEITLRGGGIGEQVGETVYPDLACHGALTLRQSTVDKIVVDEVITTDPRGTCIKRGSVTLTLTGDRLAYSYIGPGQSGRDLTATADLIRKPS